MAPRRPPTFFLCLGMILLLATALPARAADVAVSVTLEPAIIGIDETATLTMEVSGDGLSSMHFRPSFQLVNLEVLGNASQYEDMRFSNGSFTRTYRLSWTVRPLGLGRAGVRNVSAEVEGEPHPLPPREIHVRREPAQQAQRPAAGQDEEEDDPFRRFFGSVPIPRWRREPEAPGVFLRSEVQPARPVVGQQALYTIYLFTREDIAAISPSGIPPFKGFWVQDIPSPQQPPMEMVEIDGRRYGRVPLIQKALFPLRSGHYTIDPATIDLTVERYDRNFFFGPPISRPQTVRLSTAAQTLDVQPLPPAPPGFAGAVGQLALTARLEPPRLHLGEAATLTVRLSGTGNLQGLREPKVTPPDGLTIYPPQQEGKDELAGTSVRGQRSWSYVVVPDRTGRYRLEAPRVTYYDPAARRYQVAASPDLELTALPRPATALGGSGAPHGIRTAAFSNRGLTGGSWPRLLPWLFALPWGLALAFTLVRRRSGEASRYLAARPAGASSAAARLEQALASPQAEERPRQAAARLEEAWRDFLTERWDVPHATPSSRWSEMLAIRKVDDAALAELRQLLDDLDYLRYAPQLSTTDTLRAEALSRSRRLLRRLQ
jgi:hypothetical protein